MNCRSIVGIFSLLFLAAGCMTPQKFEKTIGAMYQHKMPKHPLELGKNVTERTDSLKFFGKIAIARDPDTLKKPADFWRKDAILKCRLSDSVALALFNARLNKNAPELKKWLGNKELELNLLALPHSFRYYLASDALYDLHAFGRISEQSIEPVNKDLRVAYRVTDGGSIIKSGVISIPDANRKLTNNNASARRLIRDYLGEYKLSIDQMTDSLVKKLEMEIHN